jgi:hypothetical protein
VRQLFIDIKRAYDSVRREVLYNTLIEFDIPIVYTRPVKVFLLCLASTLGETSSGYSWGSSKLINFFVGYIQIFILLPMSVYGVQLTN